VIIIDTQTLVENMQDALQLEYGTMVEVIVVVAFLGAVVVAPAVYAVRADNKFTRK
jgi:hypothetical protein